jgi:membrane protease YdiL (CAAX protease family)
MSAQVSPAETGTTAAPAPAARPEGRRRRRPAVAAWGPWTAIGAVVLGLVAGFAIEVALLAAIDDGEATAGASLVLADLVLLAVVLAFAARGATRLGPSTLGLRRTALWPAIGWGLAVLVGSLGVSFVLSLAFGPGGGGSGPSRQEHLGAGVAILIVLGIAVTAPIVEEVAFRGYLFPALATWKGPWIAAAVTGVLFGLAHVLALPVVFLAGAAAFGFGACLLFWFTGSLLPGIAIHSLNNAYVLAAVTGGRLAWAIPLAPIVALLVVAPVSRRRAPQAPEAAAA